MDPDPGFGAQILIQGQDHEEKKGTGTGNFYNLYNADPKQSMRIRNTGTDYR
jgi:hypothetical protein